MSENALMSVLYLYYCIMSMLFWGATFALLQFFSDSSLYGPFIPNIMMSTRKVVVHDLMQKHYVYERVEPVGKNFDPRFKPELTPAEMLALGVFGGKYMTDCKDEFPKEWRTWAKLSPQKKDISLNFFEVDASLPLADWQDKGRIHPDDPRGRFQWYCRYYMGRRMPEEDERQIKRWCAIKRHQAAIVKNCTPWDMSCRKKQRQALLHWAYDSRKI